MMELTSEKLNNLKELAEKATPGNWFATCDNELMYIVNSICQDRFETRICNLGDGRDSENNSAYIAAAFPDVVLAMIERINYLESKLELAVNGACTTAFLTALNKLPESLKDKLAEQAEAMERLEKEADWLAEYSALDECPLKTLGWMDNPEEGKEWCDWHPDPDGNYDCSGDNVECWRRMAREAVEEQCQKSS